MIKNYEEGSIRGKLGYALHTIKTLSQNVEPLHAVVEYNQQRLETDANVIIIANSQKYGNCRKNTLHRLDQTVTYVPNYTIEKMQNQ